MVGSGISRISLLGCDAIILYMLRALAPHQALKVDSYVVDTISAKKYIFGIFLVGIFVDN